jgi:hypothetical protein
MSDCRLCGRDDGHYIGCDGIVSKETYTHTAEQLAEFSQCAKDGCTEPRAVSKGPRPTKYCDEHKTGSKR